MAITYPKISMVIGSYNHCKLLELCIEAVRTELEGQNYEIIVVDGGSTDGAVEWLTAQKDIIALVQHNRGEWRGKAIERKPWAYFMNLGFKCATGQYICMLSDDSLIVPGAIQNGVDLFDKTLDQGVKLGGVAFYFRELPLDKQYGVVEHMGNLCVKQGLFLSSAIAEVGYCDENYHCDLAGADLAQKIKAAKYAVIDCKTSYVDRYCETLSDLKDHHEEERKQQDSQRLLGKWEGITFTAEHKDHYLKELGQVQLHPDGDDSVDEARLIKLRDTPNPVAQDRPLFSVVTIVYNDPEGLERTIESVEGQSYPFFEFIVIDGASDASTQNVLSKHKSVIDRLVSEPDTGIYNAMNKGIKCTTGAWTVFMNAGDTFHASDTLTQLAQYLLEDAGDDSMDIVYGDSLYRFENTNRQPKQRPGQPIETIRQGMPFCHQAVYYRTQVLKSFPFNETFRLAADYDQLTRLYKGGKLFRYIPLTLCDFYAGGGSESGLHPYLECLKIQFDHFGDGAHLKDSKYMKGFLETSEKLLEKYR